MTAPTVTSRFLWVAYWRDLWSRREFALYLALGNLKARNASTALGLFWWILNPLLLAAIYFLIFGVIFDARGGVENYISHLISGMFVFYFTQSCMTGGANSVLSNAKLLANQRFPRLILPISSLIESAVGFWASMVVFFLLAGLANGIWPTSAVVLLLPIFVLHVVFNLGLGAFTARLAVPFRDVNNLVPYITRLWLYMSPILYGMAQVPEGMRDLFAWNPLVPFLGVYRAALMGTPFAFGDLLAATAWALVVGVVGITAFVRHEGHMVRYL